MKHFRKISILSLLALLFSASFFISCRSDDDPSKGKAKFDVTGDFTGTLTAIYSISTYSNGDGQNKDIKTLPWTSDEFETTGHTSFGISIGNVSNGQVAGKPGQKITVKLYINNKVVKTATAIADSDGLIGTGSIFYQE